VRHTIEKSVERRKHRRPSGVNDVMNALTRPLTVPRDRDARIARLYRDHRHMVYRLCLRYGAGRSAWAEDVTGDVFVTAIERIDGLDDRDDLGGWLYRVTTRHCLKRLRRDRVRSVLGLDRRTVADERPDPGRRAEGRDRLRATLELLAHLPPKERVALCMHRLDGHTLADVGRMMGHSKGYICKLVSRADARLRALDAGVSDD